MSDAHYTPFDVNEVESLMKVAMAKSDETLNQKMESLRLGLGQLAGSVANKGDGSMKSGVVLGMLSLFMMLMFYKFVSESI